MTDLTVFKTLLNNTLTVHRRMRLADGQGGWTIVYQEVGTVQGRIRPLALTERLVAGSAEAQISHVIYCLSGEDMARGDIVTMDNLTVEVLGVREPSAAGEHWEIDCMERQNEQGEIWEET